MLGGSHSFHGIRINKDKTNIMKVKISGGASAVKEPGHFEVRKSSSQVMHSFPQKKLTTFLFF